MNPPMEQAHLLPPSEQDAVVQRKLDLVRPERENTGKNGEGDTTCGDDASVTFGNNWSSWNSPYPVVHREDKGA